jgi:hypothetical protein
MKIQLSSNRVKVFFYAKYGFIVGSLLLDILPGIFFDASHNYCIDSTSSIHFIVLLILALICVVLLSLGFQAIEHTGSTFNSTLLAIGFSAYLILTIYNYICLALGLICKSWPSSQIILFLTLVPNLLIQLSSGAFIFLMRSS